MLSENEHYLGKNNGISDRRVNILDLKKTVKDREKEDKKHTIIIAAAAISTLVISGIVISL